MGLTNDGERMELIISDEQAKIIRKALYYYQSKPEEKNRDKFEDQEISRIVLWLNNQIAD